MSKHAPNGSVTRVSTEEWRARTRRAANGELDPNEHQALPEETPEAPTAPPPWEAVKEFVPKEFRLSAWGVTRKDKDHTVRICGPCWVSAITRTPSGDNWGLLIEGLDRDSRPFQLAAPYSLLHETGKPLIGLLVSKGLFMIPGLESSLMKYLASFELPDDFRMQSTPKLGWTDDGADWPAYVLPQRTIASDGREILFQPEQHSPSTHSLATAGTLDVWQARVASPCSGNPCLMFALFAPFAGMLVKPAGQESGGFHFYGNSSKGKTTLLQVAASVLGEGTDPTCSGTSMVQKWNATANALEGIAAAHNDALLCLDEIGTCGANDFGKVVYDLIGGTGKARFNRVSALQPRRDWRLMVLSSGELSVAQRIEQDRRRPAKDGQLVRLLDIPINENLILDTHGMRPGLFVNELKRACGECFGVAAVAFLERLMIHFGSYDELRGFLKAEVNAMAQDLAPGPLRQTTDQRLLSRFGLVLVAGLLAQKLGILPFDRAEIIGAVQTIVKAWLADDSRLPEDLRGVLALRDFIHTHRDSRFRDAGDESNGGRPIRDLAGYYHADKELFIFVDSAFREACGGYPHKAVLAKLRELGLLHMDDRTRPQSKHVVAGMKKRFRACAVKAAILAFDGEQLPPRR